MQHTQFWIAAVANLPTFDCGDRHDCSKRSSVDVRGGKSYAVASSGLVVTAIMPIRVRTSGPTNIGIRVRAISATNVSGLRPRSVHGQFSASRCVSELSHKHNDMGGSYTVRRSEILSETRLPLSLPARFCWAGPGW